MCFECTLDRPNSTFSTYDLIPHSFHVQMKGSSLTARVTRQLVTAHDVLALCFSPSRSTDKLLLAASLLDGSTQLLYADSLKFFLSLYGHSLPVLCADISSDCTLLVSGSADKTVKVWGLDFGDCHRYMHMWGKGVICHK